jgi:hypothetical protein
MILCVVFCVIVNARSQVTLERFPRVYAAIVREMRAILQW